MLWLHALAVVALLLPGGSGARQDGWRAEAEALEIEGDIDAAIARVEDRLATSPEDAAAWTWLARAFERLAAGQGRSPLFLSEAAGAWERVAAVTPDAPAADDARLEAARNRLWLGEYAVAERDASRVADGRRDRGDGGLGQALALALRARMGITAAETRAGEKAPLEGLAELRAHVSAARELSPDTSDVTVVEAEWYDSLELNDIALATLRAALAEAPGDVALHRAFVDQHVARGIEERLPAAYAELLAAHDEEAVVYWYAGLALRLAGDLAARERRDPDAASLYARCVESMRRSAELEPSFAETALWLEMQARTASAWSALDADDTARAEAEWQAIADEAPEYAQRVDGLGRTAAQGLGRLGGRYLVRDELDASRRVAKEVADLTDEAWSWNNVAYLLREIASDTEASGDAGAWDVARSTFIESWETYVRAAELAPHEPRIVNDAALIQVYHLQDDLDKAEAMLNRAIEVGEAQIADLGPNPDETDRFPIAMAVGDAYQNLGFLYYRVRDEPLKAREYFIKSVDTNSGVRRGVRASIQAIDGGREVSEREVAGRPEPRQPAPAVEQRGESSGPGEAAGSTWPPAGQQEPVDVSPDSRGKPPEERGEGGEQIPADVAPDIDWERSIGTALEVSVHEGRPVLVYHRIGGGIGPSVEYLQRHLHSEAFAEETRGSITLLADELRHTFTDRRRDARLVLCPRAGGVTCGEHIRCAEEFAPLWRGSFDLPLGLESNGLFQVTDAGLARATEIEDVFERYRAPRRTGAPGGEAPEPDLLTPGEDSEVDALARSGSLPARRALERIVFDAAAKERRAAAVEAVGAHQGADNDELLTALARQHADPDLAGLALDAWRFELGHGTPLFVLQTSTSAEVRRSAARALARVGGEEVRLALEARWLLTQQGSAADAAELSLD